jgi:hypothetical protein
MSCSKVLDRGTIPVLLAAAVVGSVIASGIPGSIPQLLHAVTPNIKPSLEYFPAAEGASFSVTILVISSEEREEGGEEQGDRASSEGKLLATEDATL